jgi:hypothetical protein
MGHTVAEHPLKKWRKSKGYTLEQAAKMVGTSRPVWYDWERGRRRPSAMFMPKLRDLTGISADIFYSDAA